MYIFVSRVRKKSFFKTLFIKIFVSMLKIHLKIKKINGLQKVESLNTQDYYWLKEIWDCKENMISHRRGSNHQLFFNKIKRFLDDLASIQFEAAQAPDWNDIIAKMTKEKNSESSR